MASSTVLEAQNVHWQYATLIAEPKYHISAKYFRLYNHQRPDFRRILSGPKRWHVASITRKEAVRS